MPRVRSLADIAWSVFLLVWAIGSIANKPDIRRMAWGQFLLHCAILAVAFSLFFGRRSLFGALRWHVLPDWRWNDPAGDVLQIAGLAFAIWARLHIGRNWSGSITLKQGHSLVRSGPYALVRHPIYSGLLLAFLGKAVDHGELAGVLGFLILLAEWKRKSLMEERLMLEQFGDEYRRYRAEVKGLIPGVW